MGSSASRPPAYHFRVDLSKGVSTDLPLENLDPSTSASTLLGRGDSGPGDYQEITLGAGLNMTGTTLSAPDVGNVTKVGTPLDNQIGVWTGDGTLEGDANFTYDGSILDVKNGGTASSMKLYCEVGNAHFTELKSAPHANYTGGSKTFVLPAVDGSSGDVLQTDGLGNLTFAAPSVGDPSPLTTKGDIYTYDTGDARLGVGTNGQVLTADSAEATGLKWATPAAGGSGGTVQGTDNTYQIEAAAADNAVAPNANGTYSVNLQTKTTLAAQTASGNYSVISGGTNNTISSGGVGSVIGGGSSNTTNSGYSLWLSGGGYATVGGGIGNTANTLCTVSGGYFNTASTSYADTVGGGYNNTASGFYSTVGGGYQNTASGWSAVIPGGYTCTASGGYSFAVGFSNTASSYYSVAMGSGALADKRGQFAYSNNAIGWGQGQSQKSLFVMAAQTTSATQTSLALDGSALEYLAVPSNTTWFFTIKVAARRIDVVGESAMYEFKGGIDNNAGTVALVGTVAKTVYAEDTVAWDVTVAASGGNLDILVTGEASKSIRWVAGVDVVEVGN